MYFINPTNEEPWKQFYSVGLLIKNDWEESLVMLI